MKKQIDFRIVSLVFSVLVICFAIAFYVVAWDEPGSVPPTGNVPPPLNVSNDPQIKSGSLRLGGLTVDNDTWLATSAGNVGIGTTNPQAKLHIGGIAGTDGIMFPDGTLQTTAGGGGGQATTVKASNELSSPTSWADVQGMSITMTTNGGNILILFNTVINSEDARRVDIRLLIDGVQKVITQTKQDNTGQSYDRDSASLHWVETSLSSGQHTFKIQWKSQSTSEKMNPESQSDRVLSVVEL